MRMCHRQLRAGAAAAVAADTVIHETAPRLHSFLEETRYFDQCYRSVARFILSLHLANR